MKSKALGSAIIVLLISSISGCGTAGTRSIQETQSNPYMKQLDALDTKGATGNLLACMYFIKRTSFIVDAPQDDLYARAAINEAFKRSELNASGKFLKLLTSDAGSGFDFCSNLGEIDPNTYEYVFPEGEVLDARNPSVASTEPNQNGQWDSGVLLEYASCLKSHQGNDYYYIKDKIGWCARFLGNNYDSNNPKHLSEVQAVQYSVCLETWSLYSKLATIDDKINGCKKTIYN